MIFGFLDLPEGHKLTFVRPCVRLLPAFLISFFTFLPQRCKMQFPKCDNVNVRECEYFPAENTGNMPENQFGMISSLVFF